MIYKGKVISIDSNFAIVLTKDMEYLKVVRKDAMFVGQQILFIEEDIFNEKSHIKYRPIYIAAAIMFFILLSVFAELNIFNNISNVASAVVSLDINPSVEFEIDEYGKVLKVVPINEDGKNIIDANLIGPNIEESVNMAINNAIEKKYIKSFEEPILLTTVVFKEELKINVDELEKKIENKLSQNKKLENAIIAFLKSNKKDFKNARKMEASIGIYEIFNQSKEVNPQITIEQIKEMKIQDIVENKQYRLRIRHGGKHRDDIEEINTNFDSENETIDSEINYRDPINTGNKLRRNNLHNEVKENQDEQKKQYRNQWGKEKNNNKLENNDLNIENSENINNSANNINKNSDYKKKKESLETNENQMDNGEHRYNESSLDCDKPSNKYGHQNKFEKKANKVP